ncbi:Srs2 interacting SWIM domain protein Srs1 [Schizosaccharomyces pombe]|uniref:Zinc finger SWIM domain-containing protein sws1 n=1 Tax=Schizosaccharomyces pombe (strain 972 / ATCC 24843) TaxID=284812 RepID=SWS1_SCHPO|nr:SWIM domain-containing Srs2-interacting protein 1 [Schizosaccharomyces pombe]O13600.1 RecName: Full=Zinc finger SWIM domain-containing protein sws1; AltName: Full=SWIM domain-containing and srs2-interacting protein 1 [Schizosaccharomyces pombe 972h-]BAA21382.1 pi005 [Schizosaccharomyces pombe]CAC37510.1 SWIM domain containing-Srs2 interacting protein 1 [Schizosaccharomyces pombe]|eukprot:NP_001342994.1 SWIM domain-containing Srs2-interacting protein 1 [Schizosaccharomyces pombe]
MQQGHFTSNSYHSKTLNSSSLPVSSKFSHTNDPDVEGVDNDSFSKALCNKDLDPSSTIRSVISSLLDSLQDKALQQSPNTSLSKLLLEDQDFGSLWLSLSFIFCNYWQPAMLILDSKSIHPLPLTDGEVLHRWECEVDSNNKTTIDLKYWYCSCSQFSYNAFNSSRSFDEPMPKNEQETWGGRCLSHHPTICSHILAASILRACHNLVI